MAKPEILPSIVVVEDNVEANNLLRDWLKLRFTVTCFLDAESTLRILPASEEPVVFLIDYNMPGDNGIVLKKKLALKFPKAKYILISGLFDEKLMKEARAAGFHALVPKPFAMPTITQKIEELLGLNQKESLVDIVKKQTSKMPLVML
ncbi:MAG: response regulator [Methylacidiphilales bacterium]|nr:response regulator [Candidatus Methylacidiphilales bacterium]